MLAFNNVLVNLDSYSGVFCQNYYLYKDNTNHFNPIVWDLNMCLGGFPFVGNSNNSMGSLTVTNMQQLPITIHATDPYWPLINAVMSNTTYKKMVVAHERTIVNELFVDSSYITTATQLQALVDADVQADTNQFFSYAQFQTALTTNNNVGSYVVPGISNLMSARVSYLQSTAEFSAIAPAISSVGVKDSSSDPNDTITIIAQVSNANSTSVYLMYRYLVTENFIEQVMYDDGLHNDEAPNDNLYATLVKVNKDSFQYYLILITTN